MLLSKSIRWLEERVIRLKREHNIQMNGASSVFMRVGRIKSTYLSFSYKFALTTRETRNFRCLNMSPPDGFQALQTNPKMSRKISLKNLNFQIPKILEINIETCRLCCRFFLGTNSQV